MILVDVPSSAGRLSQLSIFEELQAMNIESALLFDRDPTAELQRTVEEKSWDYYRADSFSGEDFSLPVKQHKKILEHIEKQEGGFQRRFRAHLDGNQEKLNSAHALLQQLKPQAILLSNDGLACNFFLVSVAKALKVPVLCVPYGFCGIEDLENELRIKIKTGRAAYMGEPGADLVKKLFPKWLKKGLMDGHMMFKPEIILAWEALGVSLENPWMVYGSDADHLFAPSQQYQEHLIKEGFDAKRVSVIGSMIGQKIERELQAKPALREAFRSDRRVQEDTLKVLLSMPPNYHAKRGEMTEFPESYAALVKAVLEPLLKHKSEGPSGGFFGTKLKLDLTVSVHPSTTQADLEVYRDLGVEVSGQEVICLMPHHDLYITDYSSTVRWAVACGLPVLNYDFYKFDLKCYDKLDGVVKVSKQKDFESAIKKFLQDPGRYSKLAQKQTQVADHWGAVHDQFSEKLKERLREWS